VSAEDRETAIRIEHRELMAEEIPPLHPVRRTAWLHELRRKAENRVDDAIAGIVRR
jgi:hypothetical protein